MVGERKDANVNQILHQPKNMAEAIQALQDCIKRGGRMMETMQARVARQASIINGQKEEILRLRDLCDGAGVDWREGLGL